jgi:ABC-2 type transport system permease protein
LLSGALGTWAFVALALVLAGTLRAEGVLAVANLVWVALLGVGGVLLAADQLPAAWSGLVSALPSSALADALRGALVHGEARPADWLVLAGWAVVATALAARFFRWDD